MPSAQAVVGMLLGALLHQGRGLDVVAQNDNAPQTILWNGTALLHTRQQLWQGGQENPVLSKAAKALSQAAQSDVTKGPFSVMNKVGMWSVLGKVTEPKQCEMRLFFFFFSCVLSIYSVF